MYDIKRKNIFIFFLVVLAKVNFPPFWNIPYLPVSYGTKKLGYWYRTGYKRTGFSSFPCSRQRCNINQKQERVFRPKNFYDSLVSGALSTLSTHPSSFCVGWGTFSLFPHRNLYSQRLLTTGCRCFWTWEPVCTADVTMLLALYSHFCFHTLGNLHFSLCLWVIHETTGLLCVTE